MQFKDCITIAKLIICVASVAILVYQRIHPRIKQKDTHSVVELEDQYDLTCNGYRPEKLNPEAVPEELRDLIPLAQKWGIGDDGFRYDMQQEATDEDRQELVESLKGRCSDIDVWLDSFGAAPMSDEAGAFMYMLLGLDEMSIIVDQLPQA